MWELTGPKETSNRKRRFCNAARHTVHSLRVQDPVVFEPRSAGRRREAKNLKEVVAEQTLELRLLKKKACSTVVATPNEVGEYRHLPVRVRKDLRADTVLDDYSRYIVSLKLCTNMRAEDVTDTLELA
ncbi:hypothetical protein, partial [Yoonia sp. SDW83-1]|uniref:hypothetical protein n=1 Tax=Yoonia sp. SDW83-1 TaxID=3366945 RepID=UPI00398C4B91